jgi:hypothetical protein
LKYKFKWNSEIKKEIEAKEKEESKKASMIKSMDGKDKQPKIEDKEKLLKFD